MGSHRKWLKYLKVGIVTGSIFLLSGCNDLSDLSALVDAGDTRVIVNAPADLRDPNFSGDLDLSKTVCDPFSTPGQIGADLNHGIVASLKYLPDSAPRYTSVADYQKYGESLDATLYLSEINVPTRAFSLGFSTESGHVLQTPQGNTLYEYFTLHLEGQFKLGENDPVGKYQLALIADDGAILEVDQGSGYQTLINNDGTHSSKFVGATVPIVFSSREQKIPFRLNYYQGPRYHIALVLMWRPWPGPNSHKDPLEGKSGNSFFFDSNQVPSKPTKNQEALISRGWRPIPAANFVLPDEIVANPCATMEPIATEITRASITGSVTNSTSIQFEFGSNYDGASFQCSLDGSAKVDCTSPWIYSGLSQGAHEFKVYSSLGSKVDSTGATFAWVVDTVAPLILSSQITWTPTSFTVQWTTNEATTSRLNWGLGTAVDQVAPTDSGLRTSHNVSVNGLTSGTVYSFVFGGSDAAGNSVSSAVNRGRTTR